VIRSGDESRPLERRRFRPLPLAAALVITALLPIWIRHLAPPPEPRDFFQDWLAARRLVTGQPLYDPLALEAPTIGIPGGFQVVHSPHPPTSALVALPLAALPYRAALLTWNLLNLGLLAGTLWLIARELRWPIRRPALLVATAALMAWVPLWEQVEHGQMGLLLLALLTVAWRELRRGRDTVAGAALAVAAALKIFPAVLLGYVVLRRRPRAVLAALATLAVIAAVLTASAGPRVWVDYVQLGMPELARWRAHWANASLTGFAYHLFQPDERTLPLLRAPMLASATVVLTTIITIAIATRRALRDEPGVDRSFALALTAALLVSVVTWQHYFVMLLLPLAICASRLERPVRWSVLVTSFLLMDVPQLSLATQWLGAGPAGPASSLTLLSANFYGLLGFFLWQAVQFEGGIR
jgi:hypothetical protein